MSSFEDFSILDIEHRIRSRIGEGFQSDFLKIFCELGGNIFPCTADGNSGFALVEGGVLELGGLDGLDDLAEGDLAGGTGKQVAAGGSAAGIDHSAAPEIIENLN